MAPRNLVQINHVSCSLRVSLLVLCELCHGHRKRGRLRMTWRRAVEAEATVMGHSCGTLRTLAQDRMRWREFVAALVVYDKKGSK